MASGCVGDGEAAKYSNFLRPALNGVSTSVSLGEQRAHKRWKTLKDIIGFFPYRFMQSKSLKF